MTEEPKLSNFKIGEPISQKLIEIKTPKNTEAKVTKVLLQISGSLHWEIVEVYFGCCKKKNLESLAASKDNMIVQSMITWNKARLGHSAN